jgi:hypothetical protein
MTLDVARRVLPYDVLAGEPFTLQATLATDDGSFYGAPEDVSDVTDARVTAQLYVAAGVSRPAAVVLAFSDGVALDTVELPNGLTYPRLSMPFAGEKVLAAGRHELIVTLARAGGADPVLRADIQAFVQP